MKGLNIYFRIGIISILIAAVFFSKNCLENYFVSEKMDEIRNDIVAHTDSFYKDQYKNKKLQMPIQKIKSNFYVGRLVIKRLSLDLPILSEWSYDKIKVSPARFKGSVYDNNMIILAHNYKSHFGKIHRLNEGDEVSFIDMDNNEFNYKVANKEIIKGNDLDKILKNKNDLTLFTCTLGGKSRVVVGCKLIKK